jgi:hypothetical protein
MPNLLKLDTYSDQRGSLTVVEKIIPFDIKRVFYIYDLHNQKRGAHRHHKTIQAVICIVGGCQIYCQNKDKELTISLDAPEKCLIIQPEDWHEMFDFKPGTVLLVLASHDFEEADYIYEKY